MKAVVGWLCDPYVHMLVVGLVLVRLAIGAGGDEASEGIGTAARCHTCLHIHANDAACRPVVVTTPTAPRVD